MHNNAFLLYLCAVLYVSVLALAKVIHVCSFYCMPLSFIGVIIYYKY